jgi:hypothetical protein
MHHCWGVAGPTCHCSVLCWAHLSSLVAICHPLARARHRWWAHLSLFGTMHCCWAILLVVGLSLDPYSSSLVGPFVVVGLWSGPTHRCWNVARPYLFSFLLVIGLYLFSLGLIIGLSYSSSLGPRSLVLA